MLQKIFLSSSGSGNFSMMFTGIIMAVIFHYVPNANINDVTALATQSFQTVGLVISMIGLFRKIQNERWSAPKE